MEIIALLDGKARGKERLGSFVRGEVDAGHGRT